MTTRLITQLRPHAKNEEIYGDHAESDIPDDTVASIREQGILAPLLIAYDDRIISGHRRWAGARLAGLEKVPVVVFPSKDEDDILQALIHANKQRDKTNEQIAREAAELFKVEEKLASKRRAEALQKSKTKTITDNEEVNNPPVPELVPERAKHGKNLNSAKKGEARDKVGEKLGISGKTAVKAKVVIEKIEALKKEGRQEQAEKLRTLLNKKSIGAAYKLATAPELPSLPEDEEPDEIENQTEETKVLLDNADRPVPLQAYEAFNQLPEIRQLVSLCDQLSREVTRVSQLPVGRCMLTPTILSQIKAVKQNINGSKPAYICPYCRGEKTDCRACAGSVWVTVVTWKQAPPEMKDAQTDGQGGAA